jgi:cytochrome c553
MPISAPTFVPPCRGSFDMNRGPTLLACVILSAALSLAAAAGDPANGAPSAEQVDRQTQAALSRDSHPDRGGQAFVRYCAKCHGPRALGDAKGAIPALAGQRYAYLIRQLANFAGAERDSSAMHGVVSQAELRAPQMWADVAAYLNGLPNRSRRSTGPGDEVALGRGIFHEQCATCHGLDASGDADGFVPSLRHQHYAYLDTQMHKLARGYRHNVDEELLLFLKSFDDRDISATADYLSRLAGAGASRKKMRDDGVVVD